MERSIRIILFHNVMDRMPAISEAVIGGLCYEYEATLTMVG
jgi:hypothetical protein